MNTLEMVTWRYAVIPMIVTAAGAVLAPPEWAWLVGRLGSVGILVLSCAAIVLLNDNRHLRSRLWMYEDQDDDE